jgi:predicted XRE-type DNA-binding protein
MSSHQDPNLVVHDSGGNVFADLGLSPDTLLKAKLALVISKTIAALNVTQVEAGEIIGIDQAKVSALVNGKLTGFSVDRLFSFLQLLGRDIEISVSKARAQKFGEVRVLDKAA